MARRQDAWKCNVSKSPLPPTTGPQFSGIVIAVNNNGSLLLLCYTVKRFFHIPPHY